MLKKSLLTTTAFTVAIGLSLLTFAGTSQARLVQGDVEATSSGATTSLNTTNDKASHDKAMANYERIQAQANEAAARLREINEQTAEAQNALGPAYQKVEELKAQVESASGRNARALETRLQAAQADLAAKRERYDTVINDYEQADMQARSLAKAAQEAEIAITLSAPGTVDSVNPEADLGQIIQTDSLEEAKMQCSNGGKVSKGVGGYTCELYPMSQQDGTIDVDDSVTESNEVAEKEPNASPGSEPVSERDKALANYLEAETAHREATAEVRRLEEEAQRAEEAIPDLSSDNYNEAVQAYESARERVNEAQQKIRETQNAMMQAEEAIPASASDTVENEKFKTNENLVEQKASTKPSTQNMEGASVDEQESDNYNSGKKGKSADDKGRKHPFGATGFVM